MKNLRDIKTKKGDMVYFANGCSETVNGWAEVFTNYDKVENSEGKIIIKIERPIQYETIYEVPKQILDKQEKKYLENMIRPFRDRVEKIIKFSGYGNRKEYIMIEIQDEDDICLPYFNAGSMYKGMETKKYYTIEELGLFEGEGK